jgi:hypothetical protein
MNWLRRLYAAIEHQMRMYRYRHAVTEEKHHRDAGRHELAAEYADIARHLERELSDSEHEAMDQPSWSPLFWRR